MTPKHTHACGRTDGRTHAQHAWSPQRPPATSPPNPHPGKGPAQGPRAALWDPNRPPSGFPRTEHPPTHSPTAAPRPRALGPGGWDPSIGTGSLRFPGGDTPAAPINGARSPRHQSRRSRGFAHPEAAENSPEKRNQLPGAAWPAVINQLRAGTLFSGTRLPRQLSAKMALI